MYVPNLLEYGVKRWNIENQINFGIFLVLENLYNLEKFTLF